jgi:hypothetical protein
MIFPSPEVARAVEVSKVFLEWMENSKIGDFNTAWDHCHDGSLMYKVTHKTLESESL